MQPVRMHLGLSLSRHDFEQKLPGVFWYASPPQLARAQGSGGGNRPDCLEALEGVWVGSVPLSRVPAAAAGVPVEGAPRRMRSMVETFCIACSLASDKNLVAAGRRSTFSRLPPGIWMYPDDMSEVSISCNMSGATSSPLRFPSVSAA